MDERETKKVKASHTPMVTRLCSTDTEVAEKAHLALLSRIRVVQRQAEDGYTAILAKATAQNNQDIFLRMHHAINNEAIFADRQMEGWMNQHQSRLTLTHINAVKMSDKTAQALVDSVAYKSKANSALKLVRNIIRDFHEHKNKQADPKIDSDSDKKHAFACVEEASELGYKFVSQLNSLLEEIALQAEVVRAQAEA